MVCFGKTRAKGWRVGSLFGEEDNLMEFFDKFHAFCFGFLVLIIVITVPYTINHGDFFQNESALIIVSLLVTSLSVAYARKFEMISFGMLSKKQLLLFIAIFLLSVLETLVYIHFFAISSGAGVQHLAEVSRGISLSLILTLSWILENSWNSLTIGLFFSIIKVV